jgi:hypothetical protein
MVSKHSYSNNTDAITAETLARTTAADGLKTAISNNTDAITAEAANYATDAITAEALARTTADGLKHSYFYNTDAISNL